MSIRVKPGSDQNPLANVIGVVLAGGRSHRMGKDKRFLSFAGKSLLEHARQTLNELHLHSVLVSSTDLKDSVEDLYEDRGPLGGMISVYRQNSLSEVQGFLFVPVDMPLLTPAVLLEIVRQGIEHQIPVCFSNQYLPLYLPNKKDVESQIIHTLGQHRGAVRQLISDLNGKQLEINEHRFSQSVFTNLNKPQDWREFIEKN